MPAIPGGSGSGGTGSFVTSSEPPFIAALRIISAAGGTIYLAHTTALPPWAALTALVLIAVPTHAGAIIDAVTRVVPNFNKR